MELYQLAVPKKEEVKKVDQMNRLAEKQAKLFHHGAATMLPMFESGQFADYKLVCEEQTLDVHRVVLAARTVGITCWLATERG